MKVMKSARHAALIGRAIHRITVTVSDLFLLLLVARASALPRSMKNLEVGHNGGKCPFKMRRSRSLRVPVQIHFVC